MSIDFDSAALQTQHDEEEYDQEDYAREQEVQHTHNYYNYILQLLTFVLQNFHLLVVSCSNTNPHIHTHTHKKKPRRYFTPENTYFCCVLQLQLFLI